MKVCTQCASPTNRPKRVNGEIVCQGCLSKMKKKELVQILVQGRNVAVYNMKGDPLKFLKVSVSYQKEIAEFLRNGNYRISEMQVKNFPYLDCFTS